MSETARVLCDPRVGSRYPSRNVASPRARLSATTGADDAYAQRSPSRERIPAAVWVFLFAVVVVLAAYLRKGYFSGRPFWLDEAWVADSVRAAPWRVFEMSSTGPPLWESLLRLVPNIGGLERYRVVPFLWSVGTIAPAAALGALVARRTRLRSGYAIAAALAAAVLPHMVARQDLKHYTTEVFVALGILWLVARIEAAWSVRRLVVAGVLCVSSVLFASAAAFVAIAAFGALCICLALDRRWRPLLLTALSTVVVAGVSVFLLLTVSLSSSAEKVRDYWRSDFIPTDHGMADAFHFAVTRVGREFAYTGLPSKLVAALIILGVVVAWARGKRVVALAGPALFIGMTIAAAVRIYPFLDRRTGLFLMTVLAVYAGIAVAWMAEQLARRKFGILVALVGIVGLAITIGAADRTAMRVGIPYENVRDQVAYLERHRTPGDVVVVGFPASYGFAYYWPVPPTFVPMARPEPLISFAVTYPRDPSVVIAAYRSGADIRVALDSALARASRGRVWVVISHDDPRAWIAMVPKGVDVRRVDLPLGPSDALLMLTEVPARSQTT